MKANCGCRGGVLESRERLFCFVMFFSGKMGNIVYFYANGTDSVDRQKKP